MWCDLAALEQHRTLDSSRLVRKLTGLERRAGKATRPRLCRFAGLL